MLEQGTLPTPQLAPRSKATVRVPFHAPKAEPGVEYWLTLSFTLTNDTAWAKAGHEVAWAQFKLPLSAARPVVTASAMPPLHMEQTAERVFVTGVDWDLTFDKASGRITRVATPGEEGAASWAGREPVARADRQ